ncbi:NAD kinase [Propioniferax innocua]|uniref:NAD kinase n=1 Tax=Propioniferax innocua TaxID=1753 RepID=A0A542ZBC2_9ACTN|nr:NAD kinase [Propioniferax innocua]TQL57540.1 NAD+ kinase [Propioniferax innocua]
MTTSGKRTVAVLTHVHRPSAIEAARRFADGLAACDVITAVPEKDLGELALSGPTIEPLDLDDPDVEILVVFGGDGTILRGSEWALQRDIPVLGVNLGHVGFLAEADSHEIDAVVQHVVDRSWVVEERLTAEVVVEDEHGEEVWRSFAVNEVSIEKAARERMLEVLVSIDDRPLSRWGCDGVLISTPTGSTAYAFSAGGPVVWPGVEALLVVPLSAHALFARPMVMGPQSTIAVEVVRDPADLDGIVWCDGRRSFEIQQGMRVTVHSNEHRLRLARMSQAPFTDRLVKKFGLRVEGWRGAARAD